MKIFFRLLPWLILIIAGYLFISKKFSINTSVESKHQLLVEKIETIGKLELVRYQISDVLEHKNIAERRQRCVSTISDASCTL